MCDSPMNGLAVVHRDAKFERNSNQRTKSDCCEMTMTRRMNRDK